LSPILLFGRFIFVAKKFMSLLEIDLSRDLVSEVRFVLLGLFKQELLSGITNCESVWAKKGSVQFLN
jgi:hypothetical protein